MSSFQLVFTFSSVLGTLTLLISCAASPSSPHFEETNLGQELIPSVENEEIVANSPNYQIENFDTLVERFLLIKERERHIAWGKTAEDAIAVASQLKKLSGSEEPLAFLSEKKVDVTAYLSDNFLELQWGQPKFANCWNLVLHETNLEAGLGISSSSLFRHWMESSLAAPLAAKDLRNGDVLIYREYDKNADWVRELHGAIWLDDGLVWSKNGEEGTYQLSEKELVDKLYLGGEPKHCAEIDSSKEGCSKWIEARRIRSQDWEVHDPELKRLITTVRSFEKKHYGTLIQLLQHEHNELESRKPFPALNNSQTVRELNQWFVNATASAESHRLLDLEIAAGALWSIDSVSFYEDFVANGLWTVQDPVKPD